MVVGFDARHPRAEAFTRQHAGNLITEIIADQKAGVQTYVEEAIKAGRGPADTAREVVGRINRATGRREGGIIGLHSQQMGYVANMRAELADPERMANYFTRARRDKRYDALVRKAMAEGKPAAKADIDRIAGRYADRLLALRGETIARTEAINALRAGQHEGYVQLVESGAVQADQIIRKWSSAKDSRTRHDHLAMDGTVIRGLSAHFIAPDGSQLDYPGDATHGASAKETINCRCQVQYQVDRKKR